MMLIEQTTVPTSALPIQGFKDHLRLGTGFADDGFQDDVLNTCLRAAMAAIEARTGKVMIERAFQWELTGWRGLSEQALPVAPVSAINSITVKDRLGDATLVDPTRYVLQRDNQRPKIQATGACLPTVPLGGLVEVIFTAGFSGAWEGMPADLGQAMFLLAAHFYEHRTEGEGNRGSMPFGVSSLIEPYRTVRILGGGVA
ncbi:head-tail connector protein [Falsihalocynthiibacter sp. S25ZX9]|uniref:head-tail connector protein n=1 Tax=Falsihalocynthiibacter sp. S25ZX9 TaxID=3240870 RepID=UPI00350FE684